MKVRTRGGIALTCGVLGILLFSTAPSVPAAEKMDWSRYLVDGYQLTGNYDLRYLGGEPRVGVTIKGRPQADGARLVDSYGDENSLVRWAAGEEAEITFDLKAPRLLSAVDVLRQGKAVWQMDSSMDGKEWVPVPKQRMLGPEEGTLLAANLALPARYVRVRATPGNEGLVIQDIYIYGEKQADLGMVGGIYPAQYPPVANEPVNLRAIIRNATAQAVMNLEVVFEENGPGKAVLGKAQIAQLDPFSAAFASIPWTPTETEPYQIVVSASAQGSPAKQTATKVIPVVNRKIYLTGFSPWDNERLVHYNLFTTLGGVESYMAWVQGKTALSDVRGPCDPKDQSEEYWKSTWGNLLSQGAIDGIAMNEWATINGGGKSEPAAEAALKYIHEKYPNKIIAPWLIGDMDKPGSELYRNSDLLLCELYLNLIDHYAYRHFIDRRVNSMREWGFLDRAIICLSSFMGDESSTREELEREIAYIRYRAPEMPGVGVYGHTYFGGFARFSDELGYKYFIAPVVMAREPAQIQGQTATVTLWNVGGMNAHEVKVEALNYGGQVLGAASVPLLKAGQQEPVVLSLKEKAEPVVFRVAPGKAYTALAPPPRLEVLPQRQARGGPLQVSWDLESARISDDRVEFLKEPKLELAHQVKNDGSWMLNGYAVVSTSILSPGRYQVRIVDGKTGKPRTAPASVEIVPSLGRFFVAAVNGKPWQGDPQSISIKPGDTFDVAWDFEGKEVSGPAIYLSAPGEPLMCIDREEKPFTMTKILRLQQFMKNIQGEPLLAGRWTWPSSPRPEDLAENGGWLNYRKGPNDVNADARVKMSTKPGVWKLWIGTDFGEKKWLTTLPPRAFGAVPITPVVTVTVTP